MKQVEKQAKLSQQYLKQAMAWLAERGSEGVDLETLLGPPSPLPRALIDANGLTIQGNKEYQHHIPATTIQTSSHYYPGTSCMVDSSYCNH